MLNMATVVKFMAVAVVCLNGVLSQLWSPSWGSFNQGQGRMRSQTGSTRRTQRYLTCIGQTANNDQLRVTFSSSGSRFNPEVRVKANIQAGASSQIAGNFQLVITNTGRIDGMCDPNDLGSIMSFSSGQQSSRLSFFNRSQQQNQGGQLATIGSVFGLRGGQSVSMTDILENVSFMRLTGSGMAVCNQIVGDRCVGASLPLCCTIAKDTKTAAPSMTRNLSGGINGGFNSVGGGFGGLNTGMNSPTLGAASATNNLPTPGGSGGLVFP